MADSDVIKHLLLGETSASSGLGVSARKRYGSSAVLKSPRDHAVSKTRTSVIKCPFSVKLGEQDNARSHRLSARRSSDGPRTAVSRQGAKKL
jgi:hypothetical protein